MLDGSSLNDYSFFPQFRLEPRARDGDNDDGLAMRTADPLWMLGRQWQFGEFEGEDNGSPISAHASFLKDNVNTLIANNVEAQLNDRPLEVLVEAMTVRPKDLDLRTQVKIGEQFKRILRRTHGASAQSLINQLQAFYAIAPSDDLDEAANAFAQVMQGKTIRGGSLLKDIKEDTFADKSDDFAQLGAATAELEAWFDALYQQPPMNEGQTEGPQAKIDAWQATQLLYQFELRNESGSITLQAPDYQSGHLDWYSFDRAEVPEPQGFSLTPGYFPANLSFPAMPKKRLFSLENRLVDLGRMDINTDDLIRMMLIDFSMYSGSDWYIIPFAMNVHELCWIEEVKVRDVFGVCTPIRNGPQPHGHVGPSLGEHRDEDQQLTGLDVWDVFKIRDKFLDPVDYSLKDHFLFIAPKANRQESPPIEEVLLLRDEYANLVWGIEKKVRNQLGKPVDAYDLHLELNGPFILVESGDSEEDENIPKYRLANTVPFNWIPFLPTSPTGDHPGYVRRGYMVSNQPGEAFLNIEPLSSFAEQDPLLLRMEAIPKAGVRVILTWQRMRWWDGKTYLWQGRKVKSGRGEADSGLRFDYLTDK